MRYWFIDKAGNRRELTYGELLAHLSPLQIRDGEDAKIADPLEEVTYMTVGGMIEITF